ncbi:transcriptional regulator protein-like protein [Desulfofarcimen acetoxidans DSM 771]|uniref:Transcriptional regulator protein-like protein n=1 Tax=Desulfofarcimen acetoxidans (strain ATCC 49208 / DSM 771 / KCTC 5769 / VKM B-1644 / 5575) TaxID=485916 RepID=C8W3F3_DESAS|nr:WYL domain-containing protein [Desulfofarcimen acetoxidans]ACV63739.1 transcriptional regulator protein-like protein [Desulfofarcimen acetoxidans DSM 771]
MHDEVIFRLMRIMQLLEGYPEGLSAEQLSKITGYSEIIILEDLNWVAMQSEYAQHYSLFPDPNLEEAYEGDCEVHDPKIKWFLMSRKNSTPGISLTAAESAGLLWALEENPPSEELRWLRECLRSRVLPHAGQNSVREFSSTIKVKSGVKLAGAQYLSQLRLAVIQERLVQMLYYAKNYSEDREVRLMPLGLVFYNGTGSWYLIGREFSGKDNHVNRELVFHLERIKSLVVLGECFTYPIDFSLKDFLRCRWGMDMSPPVQVKVKFYDRASVHEKVRSELKRRGLTPPQKQLDGSLLWEGEIRGKNNFTKWILSFGSAAEIIEPGEMRRRVISIARTIYERL